MVATGLSYKQIATRLVLSHRTVQNHVQNTLGKLQLHNRVELVRYAIEHGLAGEPRGIARSCVPRYKLLMSSIASRLSTSTDAARAAGPEADAIGL